MNANYMKAAAIAGIGALALTACAPGEGPAADGALKVWTLESQPDRVEMLEEQASEFKKASGQDVQIVAVDEAQYNQLLVSGAAAGELPDVIGGVDLMGVGALAANELIEPGAAAKVVERLGAQTFNENSIVRATIDGELAAVPSDSWTSVLIYRQDLFKKAGLGTPKSYQAILDAAERLDGEGRIGFAGFTSNHEAFEHFALANGCDVVDDAGEIVLDSPQCVEAFEFYDELVGEYSAKGEQDVSSVRANYLSGRASMAVFSSFILDELAGLHPEFVPTCEECANDPAFLAKNTGVVTAIEGPSGSTGQYGKQTNWAIPVESSPAAVDFVEFMMSDGYEDWISMAPEGKVPTRIGTADDPEAFVSAWREMSSGVSEKKPLSDFYSDEVIEAVAMSPSTISEWGIDQGQAPLMGAILGEQPVVQSMSDMLTGNLAPNEAASRAAEAIRSIQDSLR